MEYMNRKDRVLVFGYVAPEKSLVVTPSTMKDEMDRVLREGTTLDLDIKASSADAAFKSAWQLFWDSYKKFYADHATSFGSWFSRLWSSVYTQTISYGNQLNDWRSRLQALGGRATEPKATAMQKREDPEAFNWKPLVITAGVLGGLGLVAFTASKVASVAGMFGGRGRR